MIFPDYHVHSCFSSDCDEEMSNIINTTKKNGATSLCITDHYDMDFPVIPQCPDITFDLDVDTYYSYMYDLKHTLLPDFDLRIGVELGIMPETTKKLSTYVNEHSFFDFVIASTHLVDGYDPYYPEYFQNKTEKEAIGRYFETILFNVKNFKDYNVYGHLDYILRYSPNKADNFKLSDYYDIIKPIIDTIVYDGKGIELNTGSLYRGLDFPHPHIDILKLYKDAGGEIITVGSDAHNAKYVNYGFDVARDLLLSLDFKYYCTFQNMKPKYNTIE